MCFCPVLWNNSVLAYSIGYKVHNWEMSVLRIWIVTFLAFTDNYTRSGGGIFTPAIILGLVETVTSVASNEVDQKRGCG